MIHVWFDTTADADWWFERLLAYGIEAYFDPPRTVIWRFE